MVQVWVIIYVVSVLVTSSSGSPRRFRRRIEYYSSPTSGANIAGPFSIYGGKSTFFSNYQVNNNGRTGPPRLSELPFGQPGPPGLSFGPSGPVELSGPPLVSVHIKSLPPSGPTRYSELSGTSGHARSRWRPPASSGPQLPPPSSPTEFAGPTLPSFAYAAQNETEYNSKLDLQFRGWEEMMSENQMSASEVNAALDLATLEVESEPAHARPAPAYSRRPPRRPAPDYEPESVDSLPLGERGPHPSHLSSYSVPHYSVTSHSSHQSSSGQSHKSATRAPNIALHDDGINENGRSKLKAVAIWTHRSRGVAYKLHDDGSLTPA